MTLINFFFSFVAFSPLFSGLFFLFQGNNLGVRGCFKLSFSLGFLQLVFFLGLANMFFWSQPNPTLFFFDYGSWFEFGELQARWSFNLDGLTMLMISLVISISFITQLYSYWYLGEDQSLPRFQCYLHFFTFYMLMLILGSNFAIFFLGWEGVGLCSFLLIGFWNSRLEARFAALKAVVVNRIGDAALFSAIGLFFSISGSLDYSVNFMLLPYLKNMFFNISFLNLTEIGFLTLANSLLLVAIMAKSAQIGLHIWLADAMEGPTPVSALIHAATMVTAGIYLAVRWSLIFQLTPAVENAMALIGAFTALFGASVACFQWDIKKIIAYSTCSQLGYMLCVCGLGGYSLGFHHLLIHGFFKALLFLAGGVLIHRLNGEQDIRKMGGLIEYTPLTFSYFLIGFSSLIGLPATAGFSSKERLLDFISGYDSDVAFTCYSLLWLALVGTSFYSVKTFFYVFFGEFRGSTAVKKSLKLSKSSQEANFFLIFFLGGLILIIFNAEELYQPYTNALDSFFLQSSGISQKASLLPILSETFASPNRLLPFSAIFFGFFIFFGSEHFSYTILSKNFFQSETLFSSYIIKKTYFVFQQSLWFDQALQKLFFAAVKKFIVTSFTLEKGVFEWLGAFSLSQAVYSIHKRIAFFNFTRSGFSSVSLVFFTYFLFILMLTYIFLFFLAFKWKKMNFKRTFFQMEKVSHGVARVCIMPALSNLIGFQKTMFFIFSPLEQFEILSFDMSNGNFRSSLGFFSFFESFNIYSNAMFWAFFTFFSFFILSQSFFVGRTWLQNFFETFFFGLGQFIQENASRAQQAHLPLVSALVILIFTYNFTGLFPYGFTFSSHFVITFFFSYTIFYGFNIFAWKRHNVKLFTLFIPSGTPFALLPFITLIELISYISRPLSLGIRLFANMMAGHTLLKILLSFVFLALFSDFIQFFFGIGGLICISTILMLDFVVAVLQVFVFVTLSLFYITDTHNVNH